MTLTATIADSMLFRDAAQAENKSVPVHRWVPWIAGYSSRFVDDVFDHYLGERTSANVLDPFSGVGTTLLSAQFRGWDSVGFEINAFAALACRVKLRAREIDAAALEITIEKFSRDLARLEEAVDRGNPSVSARNHAPAGFKTRIPFYSEPVLQKVLHALDLIDDLDEPVRDLFRIAFASVMVTFSNYSYEPSLGSRPGAGKPLIVDASVQKALSGKLQSMLADVEALEHHRNNANWTLHESSFMDTAGPLLESDSVDLALTSPPYLNNYHYVRNTRPQMYWLGFAQSPRDLRQLEETNFGRFWQTVREASPITLDFPMSSIEDRIEEIRELNPEKGIYGGNGWANYAATYYNDVDRCLAETARALKPGGAAVFVVGNSIIQGVHLKIDEHFGLIGERHGLVFEDNHIVREKRVGSSIVNTGLRSKGEKIRLYDAAVVLRKR